jgi:His-Xaa-Ser system protein HxsD
MNEDHQVTAEETAEGVVLSFEESIYPKDAVFGAAYTLLDRCFVHIDRDGTHLKVRLRVKPGLSVQTDQLAGEFESEALAQAWRREIIRENQALIEGMTTRAVGGAAGPPGLDDLLDEDLGDLGDAFDDPLGIAVSWEEKYGKGEAEASAGSDDKAEGSEGGE